MMTSIAWNNGRPVMVDGKVGAAPGCCCGACPCECVLYQTAATESYPEAPTAGSGASISKAWRLDLAMDAGIVQEDIPTIPGGCNGDNYIPGLSDMIAEYAPCPLWYVFRQIGISCTTPEGDPIDCETRLKNWHQIFRIDCDTRLPVCVYGCTEPDECPEASTCDGWTPVGSTPRTCSTWPAWLSLSLRVRCACGSGFKTVYYSPAPCGCTSTCVPEAFDFAVDNGVVTDNNPSGGFYYETPELLWPNVVGCCAPGDCSICGEPATPELQEAECYYRANPMNDPLGFCDSLLP